MPSRIAENSTRSSTLKSSSKLTNNRAKSSDRSTATSKREKEKKSTVSKSTKDDKSTVSKSTKDDKSTISKSTKDDKSTVSKSTKDNKSTTSKLTKPIGSSSNDASRTRSSASRLDKSLAANNERKIKESKPQIPEYASTKERSFKVSKQTSTSSSSSGKKAQEISSVKSSRIYSKPQPLKNERENTSRSKELKEDKRSKSSSKEKSQSAANTAADLSVRTKSSVQSAGDKSSQKTEVGLPKEKKKDTHSSKGNHKSKETHSKDNKNENLSSARNNKIENQQKIKETKLHIKGEPEDFDVKDRMESPVLELTPNTPAANESNGVVVDPSHNSLETVESGISMTSPNDLSDDGEVDESISSRLVEVDEMELNDEPSTPSSSVMLQSVNQADDSDNKMYDGDYEVYEDDFENYDSDFENEDMEEEEESDSSGDGEDDADGEEEEDYDSEEDEAEEYLNNENNNRQVAEIVKAIEAENNRVRITSDGAQSTVDNGANSDHVENTKSILKPSSRPKTARAIVNFARAKEKAKVVKAAEKLKNRGQILQEMIQLDTISIELFTQVSDSYEAYISAFGKANTMQVGVYTNEDNLSESVQTDNPHMLDKWTQKPVNVSSDTLDYSGVGGDSIVPNEDEAYKTYLSLVADSGRLTKFLDAASQVILQILEEESIFSEEMLTSAADSESHGFSKSRIALGSGLNSLLDGRSCTFVSFCPSEPSLVLSGHGFKESSVDITRQESEPQGLPQGADGTYDASAISGGALICLWSVHQPSYPKVILSCRSPALASCFSHGRPVAVVSGLEDGSLAAWDLREKSSAHPLIISSTDTSWRLRSPSFITACSQEEIAQGSEIVALQTLVADDSDNSSHDGSFQIVSLTSSGQLTWWVFVQEGQLATGGNEPGVSTHLGAAPWSRIVLSRAATLSLPDQLSRDDLLSGSSYCYDMKVARNDPNLLYISTANGRVIHCSRHSIKVHPSVFSPSIEPGTEAVSIAVCPHDSQYFLVGGTDGLIRLHSTTLSQPLTCWQASGNPTPIRRIQWSPSRPCVFYMLDIAGVFHIWDLTAGDIFPTVSVDDGGLIGGKLIAFDLALPMNAEKHPVYAIFASESGALGIRSIAAQFLRTDDEEYHKELQRFKCYVDII